MAFGIRRPHHTKSGRLYMVDSKGRYSNPTPAQKKLYGKKHRKTAKRRR